MSLIFLLAATFFRYMPYACVVLMWTEASSHLWADVSIMLVVTATMIGIRATLVPFFMAEYDCIRQRQTPDATPCSGA